MLYQQLLIINRTEKWEKNVQAPTYNGVHTVLKAYGSTLSLVSLGYLLPMGHHRPLSNLQEDVIEAQDFGILFQSVAFDNPS